MESLLLLHRINKRLGQLEEHAAPSLSPGSVQGHLSLRLHPLESGRNTCYPELNVLFVLAEKVECPLLQNKRETFPPIQTLVGLLFEGIRELTIKYPSHLSKVIEMERPLVIYLIRVPSPSDFILRHLNKLSIPALATKVPFI